MEHEARIQAGLHRPSVVNARVLDLCVFPKSDRGWSLGRVKAYLSQLEAGMTWSGPFISLKFYLLRSELEVIILTLLGEHDKQMREINK